MASLPKLAPACKSATTTNSSHHKRSSMATKQQASSAVRSTTSKNVEERHYILQRTREYGSSTTRHDLRVHNTDIMSKSNDRTPEHTNSITNLPRYLAVYGLKVSDSLTLNRWMLRWQNLRTSSVADVRGAAQGRIAVDIRRARCLPLCHQSIHLRKEVRHGREGMTKGMDKQAISAQGEPQA